METDPLVSRVSPFLSIELWHAQLSSLVMQRNHLPKSGIENRAAGAATLGGRPVMDPADVRDLRLAGGRAFMIEELVVLEGESEIAATGMADNVNPRGVLEDRQRRGQRQRFDPRHRSLES